MRNDAERNYYRMEKSPERINPIFLNKPYSACGSILRSFGDEGKESINDDVKCRKKAQGEHEEGKE